MRAAFCMAMSRRPMMPAHAAARWSRHIACLFPQTMIRKEMRRLIDGRVCAGVTRATHRQMIKPIDHARSRRRETCREVSHDDGSLHDSC